MKRLSSKKLLSLIGCIVLTAALAMLFTGCGATSAKETVSAENATSFTVEVTDLEGAVTTMELTSDKATVGEALLEQGIVEGEEGSYGLYVTVVNGIELDWERDQKYWAFYIDGEYAMTGVDQTELKAGSIYGFKPEG